MGLDDRLTAVQVTRGKAMFDASMGPTDGAVTMTNNVVRQPSFDQPTLPAQPLKLAPRIKVDAEAGAGANDPVEVTLKSVVPAGAWTVTQYADDDNKVRVYSDRMASTKMPERKYFGDGKELVGVIGTLTDALLDRRRLNLSSSAHIGIESDEFPTSGSEGLQGQ